MSAHIQRDFLQRYAGTYLKATVKGVSDIYFIHEGREDRDVSATNEKFEVVLTDSKETTSSCRFCDIVFDYSLPRSKVITMDKAVYFVAQRADRQWKRGISGYTYTIDCPTNVIQKELTDVLSNNYVWPKTLRSVFCPGLGELRRVDWGKVAKELLNMSYPSYISAHTLLREGQTLSAAFASKYFLSLSAIDDGFTWWRGCLPIAQVSSANPFTINCFENGLFRQEIIDFLRNKGFQNVNIQ